MKKLMEQMGDGWRAFRACVSESLRQARQSEAGHPAKYRFLEKGSRGGPDHGAGHGKVGVFLKTLWDCFSVAMEQARQCESGDFQKGQVEKVDEYLAYTGYLARREAPQGNIAVESSIQGEQDLDGPIPAELIKNWVVRPSQVVEE
jgi:hypothetical protein